MSSASELSAGASRSASESQANMSNSAPQTQTTSNYSTNASATPTPMSQDNKDNSGGLSAGAQEAIGAACGLLGLAALLVLVF
jgi:uncharacterized membrane protein